VFPDPANIIGIIDASNPVVLRGIVPSTPNDRLTLNEREHLFIHNCCPGCGGPHLWLVQTTGQVPLRLWLASTLGHGHPGSVPWPSLLASTGGQHLSDAAITGNFIRW